MTLHERIQSMSVRAREKNHLLERVELDKETFRSLLDELGAFFEVRSEDTLRKHCSGCTCKPHFFLATPGGMVKIEKAEFNCAYVLK